MLLTSVHARANAVAPRRDFALDIEVPRNQVLLSSELRPSLESTKLALNGSWGSPREARSVPVPTLLVPIRLPGEVDLLDENFNRVPTRLTATGRFAFVQIALLAERSTTELSAVSPSGEIVPIHLRVNSRLKETRIIMNPECGKRSILLEQQSQGARHHGFIFVNCEFSRRQATIAITPMSDARWAQRPARSELIGQDRTLVYRLGSAELAKNSALFSFATQFSDDSGRSVFTVRSGEQGSELPPWYDHVNLNELVVFQLTGGLTSSGELLWRPLFPLTRRLSLRPWAGGTALSALDGTFAVFEAGLGLDYELLRSWAVEGGVGGQVWTGHGPPRPSVSLGGARLFERPLLSFIDRVDASYSTYSLAGTSLVHEVRVGAGIAF